MADEDLTLRDRQDAVRERADAYLTIHSENDSPETLASAVGLQPEDSWRRGDPRGRLKQPAETNAVHYTSLLDEQAPPSDHITALASRLLPYAQRIDALAATDGNRAVVRIVELAGFATEWFANVETHVDAKALQTLAAMGATLVFDAYIYTEDD